MTFVPVQGDWWNTVSRLDQNPQQAVRFLSLVAKALFLFPVRLRLCVSYHLGGLLAIAKSIRSSCQGRYHLSFLHKVIGHFDLSEERVQEAPHSIRGAKGLHAHPSSDLWHCSVIIRGGATDNTNCRATDFFKI